MDIKSWRKEINGGQSNYIILNKRLEELIVETFSFHQCNDVIWASPLFQRYKLCTATHLDIEYRSLIFSFIDNVKPTPEKARPKFKSIDLMDDWMWRFFHLGSSDEASKY